MKSDTASKNGAEREEDAAFANKIALLNTICYCTTICTITYVDSNLNTHAVVEYRERVYDVGYYWILLAGAPLFFVTRWALTTRHLSLHGSRRRTFAPSIILIAFGIFPLWDFRLELPHGALVATLGLACMVSWLTCWLHFQTLTNWTQNVSVKESARIERIKEACTFWRTLTLTGIVGFIALLIPLVNYVWSEAEQLTGNKVEKMIVVKGTIVRLLPIVFYIFIGIFGELFKITQKTADYFLDIKETDVTTSPK